MLLRAQEDSANAVLFHLAVKMFRSVTEQPEVLTLGFGGLRLRITCEGFYAHQSNREKLSFIVPIAFICLRCQERASITGLYQAMSECGAR